MAIRVLTLDELSEAHDLSVAALRSTAFSDLYGKDRLLKWREAGVPMTPYTALYAVDGAEVQSMLEVHRFSLQTTAGVATAAGLAYVCTREKSTRRGLATLLIHEVMDRERKAGTEWLLLGTGRHLVAHALYQKLGFKDLWSSGRAIRKIPAGMEVPKRYRMRPMGDADALHLERLREEMGRGCYGFVHRQPPHVKRCVGIGRVESSQVLVITPTGGQLPVAYGILRRSDQGFICWEAVASLPEHRSPLVQALESRAAGRWLLIGTSPEIVWREVLEARGYHFIPDSYGTWMALNLKREMPVSEMREVLRAGTPRFVMQDLDSF